MLSAVESVNDAVLLMLVRGVSVCGREYEPYLAVAEDKECFAVDFVVCSVVQLAEQLLFEFQIGAVHTRGGYGTDSYGPFSGGGVLSAEVVAGTGTGKGSVGTERTAEDVVAVVGPVVDLFSCELSQHPVRTD